MVPDKSTGRELITFRKTYLLYTTNSLRDKTSTGQVYMLGFLSDLISTSTAVTRYDFHPHDCVPLPSINRNLKMPKKALIQIRKVGTK